MKYKKEGIIIIIISILVLFLKYINVLQTENGLGLPYILFIFIVFFSFLSIKIQNNIDINKQENSLNYYNLDILKYIFSILIIILHLRPFYHYSNELDLAFNNIVTRICVPIYFVITGYFVAINEKKKEDYIKTYIKNMIPFYLSWSVLYVPVILGTIIQYLPTIQSYVQQIHISIYLFIPLCILLLPIGLFISLFYSGVYYHLWYFPALMISLIVLKKWKNKWDIKYLLGISFILLLFGATETYYGVLPISIRQIISYYFTIFFTTRNFLFFGLFYVVLGYYMGTKKDLYAKYCFEKLIISFFLLVFEAILLHDTERINSNILLSCIPLTYYLFICVIYLTKNKEKKYSFSFRGYSKYYYLIHPMIIFSLFSLGIMNWITNPYMRIILVFIITHVISYLLIYQKKKYKYLVL